MNFNQYQNLALRTIKPHATKELAVCDWTLGLMGEIAEVREALLTKHWTDDKKMELAKEVGDVLWYTAALTDELELGMADILSQTFDDRTLVETLSLDNMTFAHISAGKVCELIKHHIMHHEELNQLALRNSIYNMIVGLHGICKEFGFRLDSAAELNEAKLSHRYDLDNGNKYSEEASKNRHARENQFKDTDKYRAIRRVILGGWN